MAVHGAPFSSPMKFFSSQIKFWIKEQFCHRLWHFSPRAIRSCSSQIHCRTCSSINHDVTYQQGRTVLEQREQVKLHNVNSDARPSQMYNRINVSQTTATSDSPSTREQLYPQCVRKVTERTTRGHEVMRNVHDLNSPSCRTEPAFSSDADFNDKVKPRRLLNIYTDASGRYGLGCVWDKKWIVSQWEEEWLSNNYRCMELLEMKAVLVAILTWGHEWTGSIVRFHCDNVMVVEYFNQRARLNHRVSEVYKSTKLAASEFGFELIVEQANKSYIQFQGTDSLSRLDFSRFHKLLPYMNSVPDLPPRDLEFLLPNNWENICVSVKLRSQKYVTGIRNT